MLTVKAILKLQFFNVHCLSNGVFTLKLYPTDYNKTNIRGVLHVLIHPTLKPLQYSITDRQQIAATLNQFHSSLNKTNIPFAWLQHSITFSSMIVRKTSPLNYNYGNSNIFP